MSTVRRDYENQDPGDAAIAARALNERGLGGAR
jgi:hypothetical protein